MKFVNEYYQSIENDEALGQHFWVYNINEKDIFLHWTPNWDIIESDMFYFRMNDKEIAIPDSFYILLAGPCGRLDWINIGETIGRNLTAFVMDIQMESDSWRIYPFVPTGCEHEQQFYVPNTDKPMVVALGDDEAIIVSRKEHFQKMKYFDVTDII